MAFHLFQGLAVQRFRIAPEIRARFNDESVCKRCGVCCHSGITLKGRMILLKDLPCRHLVYESENLASCRVYKKRDKLAWCNRMNVWTVARGLFPNDCPYVQGIKNYSGKVALSDEEFKGILPELRKIFKDYPRPDYISVRTWNRFLYKVLNLPRPQR